MITAAETPKLGTTIFKVEDLAAKPTGLGGRREVTDRPTATLARFECHLSTLNPGRASHSPPAHPEEQLIILRDAALDVNLNGQVQHAGPGSILFFASNQPYAVQNNGNIPVTYIVFTFSTGATRTAPANGVPVAPGRLSSSVWERTKMAVIATPKGARRDVVDSPTATLANLEIHISTINPGEIPHAAHRHPDEEIILVEEGELDVTISGQVQPAGAGAIIFFASNDEHGLKNAGTVAATYCVIRLNTDATPVTVMKN